MDVDLPNVILDAILDERTALDVVRQEIKRLKLEDERTNRHHAAQLRAPNERHATEVENLRRQLAVFQMVVVVPSVEAVVDA